MATTATPIGLFQSLSGFQVRCNLRITPDEAVPESIMFQSLSGFQVRCNTSMGGEVVIHRPRFNPYRVFKFVATLITIICNGLK